MLVKVGLEGTIGFWGNDGDASTLANEVTDSIAVVPLVHNSVSARFEVALKQGLCLVKVGDVGPSQNEFKGVSHPAAIFDIATTADLWLADSPKYPTKMNPTERGELVELMVNHGKQNNPAALFRLGCCFWHGEVLHADMTAAQKC